MKRNDRNEYNTLVSIIIPVHNGTKTIRKAVKNLCHQDYKELEILLVENNSSDSSFQLCRDLAKEDDRICSISVKLEGTALARKTGVEHAHGEYILFHDQDDELVDSCAVRHMLSAIQEDNTDICQFGYVKSVGGIKKRIIPKLKSNIVSFQRSEFLEEQIKGVLGFGWSDDIYFGTQVWNKIYRTEVLKNCVKHINSSLFFSEDQYLNTWAFFDEQTRTVSVRPECYYVWNAGIGYSSSYDAQIVLLRDLQLIKKDSVNLVKKYCNKDILNGVYWDSLNIFRWTVYNYIYENRPKPYILDVIDEVESFGYIQEAKEELGALASKEQKAINSYIPFLTSSYSTEEYYT